MKCYKAFKGFRATVASTPTVKKVKNVTEVSEVVSKTKIQGRSMEPMHIKSTIFKYHGDTKKIHEERVVPVPKRGATSQYKYAPIKAPVKKLNPVNRVKNRSNTVSVPCAGYKQAVGGSSSNDGGGSSTSDVVTGNTAALTEELKPQQPEIKTLPTLQEGALIKDDVCPEVFNEEKGEVLDAEEETIVLP